MTEKKKPTAKRVSGGAWSNALKAMSDRENRIKRSGQDPREDEETQACSQSE